MYYLELLHKFWQFNEKSKLGANVAAVYLYLLKTGYENKRYDFTVSDLILCRNLNLTRKTVKSIKQKLCNHGLIMFETRNGHPSFYRLMLNYSMEACKKKIISEENITMISNDLSVETLIANQNFTDITQPTLKEFIGYAKTFESYESNWEAITLKYSEWQKDNWRNAAGRPITDWKLSLKNILPFLINKENIGNINEKSPL